MSRLSRTKGKAFERLIARDLRELYPHARRGLQSRDGADASDVIDVPFWLECKHRQCINVGAAIRQALKDARAAQSPHPVLVVTRANRGEVVASMPWAAFLGLLQSLEDVTSACRVLNEKLEEAKGERLGLPKGRVVPGGEMGLVREHFTDDEIQEMAKRFEAAVQGTDASDFNGRAK